MSLTNLFISLLTNLILKLQKKNIGLVNLSIYYTWKNIMSKYNNNKFNISAPTGTNKIKNRITFKVKTGYKLEFLSQETMKLLESTKKMLIKMKMEKMSQD